MLHTEASQLLIDAFGKIAGRPPSDVELAKVQAVAWLETNYARGGQFKNFAQAGKFCWGALQKLPGPDGSCPPGTAPGFDSAHARCFYVFDSDAKAVEAFLGTLLTGKFSGSPPRASTIAALSGTPLDLAREMKSHGYFEATPDSYAQAIAGNLSKGLTGKAPAPFVYGITDAGNPIASEPPGWSPLPKQPSPVTPPSPSAAIAPWYKSTLGIAAIATGLGVVAYTQRARLKGLVRA